MTEVPLDRAVALLGELVAHPTVSADPNIAMIDALEDRLSAAGARCFRTEDETGAKANLFATFGPDAPGGVMLSGHTDVVPAAAEDWASDPFEMTERAGRLHGRGTCDMKGFLAAAVVLAEAVDPARLTRPLHLAFTHDEEVGCLGAGHLVAAMRDRGLRPDIAILGEPTGMRVIEGHKGCCEYTTRFTGLAGHGSDPAAGVNAAEYAARYVARLLSLRDELVARAPRGGRFEPPWTTINVGRIAAGVAHNVIAAHAEIDWEMRPVRWADADHVHAALARLCEDELLPAMRAVHPEAGIATEVVGEVAGLEPMAANAARELAAELTGANGAGLVAFGTEAGLFQALGTDVVVCGPGSIAQAHKPDEYLALDQLAACCAMLGRLGARMAAA